MGVGRRGPLLYTETETAVRRRARNLAKTGAATSGSDRGLTAISEPDFVSCGADSG